MSRRRSTSSRKSKFDFTGANRPTYDPAKEGYGSPAEWASMFNVRMGFKEAQEWKAGSTRQWGSDWTVLGDIAGVHIDENSMWSEVKAAFRKAARNTHPDFVSSHGKSSLVNNFTGEPTTADDKHAISQGEWEFKNASAAFAMLEDIYRSKNRLN